MRWAVQILKDREDSLMFGLSLFLLVGSVCGSIFCNVMSAEMKRELQISVQSMSIHVVLQNTDRVWYFLQTAVKRLRELMFLFLISYAPCSALLFMVLMLFAGFSAAVTVCALTMDSGISGIIRCLCLAFPHGLFYIPVLYISAWWMPLKKRRLTAMSAAALALFVVLGAAAESFINPGFTAFFTGK